MNKTIIFFLAFCFTSLLFSQDIRTPSPIIFIYDASGSMWGQINGKTKMEIASNVLSNAVATLPDNQKLGLVIYGHRKKGDCTDVEFLVDIENGTKSDVQKSILGINPLGKTPLAYSTQMVIEKLQLTTSKATIILITDGIESCDGNICDVIQAAKENGIDFKFHIIGFGIADEDTQQLKCAAKAGGGNYYYAGDAKGLGGVLNDATKTTVDQPDGNILVYAIKNGNPIDALVSAYDILNKHKPVSVRTYQDTARFYLPPGKYNFDVTPLGGSDVDKITVQNVESFKDKIVHHTISFDSGKLSVTTTNNDKNWDCLVKLIDNNGKVAASFRTYQTPKDVEVNPGTYKITIQALAMEGIDTYTEIDSVSIQSGEITPVHYNFKTGNFHIFTRVGDENIDTVVTIYERTTRKNVAGSRTYTKGASFLLNPGSYEVNITPIGIHKNKKSQTIIIELEQGDLVSKEVVFSK